MRPDRALEVALRPAQYDRDDLVNALVALRIAYDDHARTLAAAEPVLREAGELRRERADVDARRASAVALWEQGNERLAHTLNLLDELALAAAGALRAAWGIQPYPPRTTEHS